MLADRLGRVCVGEFASGHPGDEFGDDRPVAIWGVFPCGVSRPVDYLELGGAFGQGADDLGYPPARGSPHSMS